MIRHRTWLVVLAVVLLKEGGAAAQLDAPGGSLSPSGGMGGGLPMGPSMLPGTMGSGPQFGPRDSIGGDRLPFMTQPERLQGPPRAMGELPSGESQPPSTLPGRTFTQPPRAMGEAPGRDLGDMPGIPSTFPIFPQTTGGGILSPFGAVGGTPSADFGLPLFLPGTGGEGEGEGPGGELPPALPPGTDPGAGFGAPARLRPTRPRGPALSLEEVLVSTERTYPPFLAILEGRRIARGDVLSALGPFDTLLNADSRNFPLGYYDRAVHDVFIEQPFSTVGGEYFFGYRLAYGNWPTYYNYLNTKGGGAFVGGVKLPLLQNFAIDMRRARFAQAVIEQERVEPTILRERITLYRNAGQAYWEWVAAGQTYLVATDLVRLVEFRYQALEGQAPRLIRAVDVESFRLSVLTRQQQLINARRRFQRASIELSLFLRDARTLPALPELDQVPEDLPVLQPPDLYRIEEDIQVALRLRPEIYSLRLQAQRAMIEREFAQNQTLPSLSLYMFGEQNVGPRPVDIGSDNRPFILEASLLFDVPIQRRFARGRVIAADGALRQIALQTRFAADRIRADIQDAMTNIDAAYENYSRLLEFERRSAFLEEAERRLFATGLSSILNVFIREQATADAKIQRINGEANYYIALLAYRAAMGLDALPPDLQRRLVEDLAVPDAAAAGVGPGGLREPYDPEAEWDEFVRRQREMAPPVPPPAGVAPLGPPGAAGAAPRAEPIFPPPPVNGGIPQRPGLNLMFPPPPVNGGPAPRPPGAAGGGPGPGGARPPNP